MSRKLTTAEFIAKAEVVHGLKYDYSKVSYTGSKTKVTIICKRHGEFKQIPNSHLGGGGCPECGTEARAGSQRSNTESFIEKAKIVHGDKYDYSKVYYTNNYTKVIVICPEHEEFEQTPDSHLRGIGCPHCANGAVSQISQQWLDTLNLPNLEREYRIDFPDGAFRKVDAYDPDSNTIYEFHGDYWHGNHNNPKHPKLKIHGTHKIVEDNISYPVYMTMVRHRSNLKDQMLRNLGYNLIIKWEYDFKNEISEQKRTG